MSIVEVIFSMDFLMALTVYALLSIISMALMHKIETALEASPLYWPWEHVASPMIKVGLMLTFILLCYPGIFGLQNAPSLSALYQSGSFNSAINWLFVIAVLIPLLPTMQKLDELVLPVQGIICCAVLFSYLSDSYAGIYVSYLPDTKVVVYIAALGFFTHWLAGWLSGYLGAVLDRKLQVSESRYLVFRIVVLVMQSPAILIYSLMLGRQLGAPV